MDENGFKKVAAGLTLSGGLLIASAASLTFVPVGSVGVRTTLGKVTGETCDEGLRLKFPPFVAGIHKMDAKIQKLELDLEGSTKDLQTVQTGLALNFRLDKSKAPEVYRAFGDEYAERVIRPNMSEVYKAICARYNAEELITKRETVSGEVLESAQNILGEYGVVVERVSIAQFDFSDAFDEAVEAKVTAEQAAQKAKNELERVKFEAQQAEEKAKGEANATLARAEAEAKAAKLIAESITPAYVAYEAARKWDGKAPTHILGDAAIPFLNVDAPTKTDESRPTNGESRDENY